jgi:spore maturation protein SpmA
VARFFLVAAAAALAQWLLGGQADVFSSMVQALFAMARLSVEVMVLLFGTLTLWLGFLRIAEKAGVVEWLAKMLGPLFAKLMPEVPRGHPALGLITLNFAANGLGLDNAATPMGLKAMRALQELNPKPDTATNAQILFLVLNASSLTLLPVTIFMYRMQQGAADPTLVFLPILLATSASTLVGLFSVHWCSGCPVQSRGAGLSAARGAGAGSLHGLSGHAQRGGAGPAFLAHGQPHAVCADRAVRGSGRTAQGGRVRQLYRGGQGGL